MRNDSLIQHAPRMPRAHWHASTLRQVIPTPEPTLQLVKEAPATTTTRTYRTYDVRSARSYSAVLPLLDRPKPAGVPVEARGRTVRRHGAERIPSPVLTEQDDEAFLAHLAGELEASESPENIP